MDKGTKMSPREVERIAILTGAGKSVTEIARELNRSRNTVTAYITAIRQATDGKFVHQSGSFVRPELIQPYIRKEGKPKKEEEELIAMDI